MATPLEARINEILAKKIFPDAKAWCLAATLPNGKTVSPNYLSTLRTRLRAGEAVTGKYEYMDALARAAGVTWSWLIGKDDAPVSHRHRSDEGKDPTYGEFSDAVRARHGLAAALALEPNRWKMETVLRALKYEEPKYLDGQAVKFWTDLLEGLEVSTRRPEILGTGDAVLAATLAQLEPKKKATRVTRVTKPRKK